KDRQCNNTLNRIVIQLLDCQHKQLTNTWIRKELLYKDIAIEDRAECNTQAGHLRQEAIAQSVTSQNLARLESFSFREQQVILTENGHQEHARGKHPATDADDDDGERGKRPMLDHTRNEIPVEAGIIDGIVSSRRGEPVQAVGQDEDQDQRDEVEG